MWFLAALVTTLGAAYLYSRLEQYMAEIAVGCLAIALGSLLITLIIAPWQVQLVLLVSALVSYPLTKTDLIR